jgi:hypothetical protein
MTSDSCGFDFAALTKFQCRNNGGWGRCRNDRGVDAARTTLDAEGTTGIWAETEVGAAETVVRQGRRRLSDKRSTRDKGKKHYPRRLWHCVRRAGCLPNGNRNLTEMEFDNLALLPKCLLDFGRKFRYGPVP